MTTKYDYALSQFPGKIIVVRCDTCDVDYDVREVTNEVQHPHALHVMAFDCPKGHHSEARRLWKENAPRLTEGAAIFLRGPKVLCDAPEEGNVKSGTIATTIPATVEPELGRSAMSRWARFVHSTKLSRFDVCGVRTLLYRSYLE